MRVYIGPYPNNHWSCHNFFEDMIGRRHGKEWGWEVEEKDYDRVDRAIMRISDAWQWVLNCTINPIVRHRRRKIDVRIDPSDTWGMDTTLAYIILPMLKQLKETKHGSPLVDDKDVPKKLRSTSAPPKENEWDTDDFIHDRWDWVMDEMIWAFEQLVDEDEGRKNYYVPYEEGEKVERICWTSQETGETTYLLTEDEARKTGKYDPDLHKKYQDKINRGLALFGKYYQGLWD